MRQKFFFSALLLVLAQILWVQAAWSQIPQTISYQGVLTDAGGIVVPDGNYQLTFRLYDAASNGDLLWTEVHNSVAVSKGIFNVILGSLTPLGLAFDRQYWLGVTVGGGSELTPRIQLTSSPYSLSSQGGAGDGHSLDAADGDPTDVVFVDNSGNVGVGTTSPAAKLDVNGDLAVSQNVGIGTGSDPLRSLKVIGSGSRRPLKVETFDGTAADINYKMSSVDKEWFVGLSGNADFDFFDAQGLQHPLFLKQGTGNVGVGTTNPAEKLDVAGTVKMSGLKLPTGATSGYVLTSDASGVGSWQPAPGGGIGGSGTANFIPKFSGTTTLGSSGIFEDGAGNVGIGTTMPTTNFEVAGYAKAGSGLVASSIIYPSATGTLVIGGNTPFLGGQQFNSYLNVKLVGSNNAGNKTAAELMVTGWDPGQGSIIGTAASVLDGFLNHGAGKVSFTAGNSGVDKAGNIELAAGNSIGGGTGGDIVLTAGTGGTSNGVVKVLAGSTEIMRADPGGNVGIGMTSPTEKLDVAGTVQMIGLKLPTGATSGYVLTSDASGVGSWQSAPSGGLGGSGTANFLPKFTGSTAVGNSGIFEDGTGTVGIGTTSPDLSSKLHVAGNLTIPTNSELKLDGGAGASMIRYNSSGSLTEFFAYPAGGFEFYQGGTPLVRIQSTGNVGIGTMSPAFKLDIAGETRSNGDMVIGPGVNKTLWFNTNTGVGSLTRARVGFLFDGVNNNLDLAAIDGTSNMETARVLLSQNGSITFRTNNADVARIDGVGRLGLGTTTPAEKLDVAGTVQMTGFKLPTGATTGYVLTSDATGAGTWQPAASGGINGSGTTNFIPKFSGATALGNSGIFEAGSGNIGIGTTGPTAKLDVIGSAQPILDVATNGGPIDNTNPIFRVFGDTPKTVTPIFAVYRGGDIGIRAVNPTNILTIQQNSGSDPIADAWTTYSSRRWKTNIKTLGGALDKVQRLRGVAFDWKADGKHDLGLIAEEVGEVIPEVVAYEENGKDAKSVDYARLVAVLIEAMKEQQKEIAELKAAVKSLMAEKQEMKEKSVGELR